jgi:hypothetical protein
MKRGRALEIVCEQLLVEIAKYDDSISNVQRNKVLYAQHGKRECDIEFVKSRNGHDYLVMVEVKCSYKGIVRSLFDEPRFVTNGKQRVFVYGVIDQAETLMTCGKYDIGILISDGNFEGRVKRRAEAMGLMVVEGDTLRKDVKKHLGYKTIDDAMDRVYH